MFGLGREFVSDLPNPRMIPGLDNVKFIAVRTTTEFGIALTGISSHYETLYVIVV
jgi:hypothetical protein